MRARYLAALAHLQPVVDDRDMPIGDNWKPEVCPRYAAHIADQGIIGALHILRRAPKVRRMAAATFGIPRNEMHLFLFPA